ncbi:MAG TPA: hypothetical protein PKA05_02370 [Roseiflexaceae bacterium]|nr:hypothetical protein [Roseiflexaceae bacterium]
MQLQLVRHLWGIDEPWEVSFPRIRAAGYTAIEAPVPAVAEQSRFRALLDAYGFGYVAMVFTAGAGVAEHVASFRHQVAASLALQPLLINSHNGRDAWDAASAELFFTEALAFEQTIEVPVAHETHRGRVMFHPWATARLLDRFADLRLCCDLSHWVCVCERLIDDEIAIIEQCAQQTIHLHARVGYEQGPQVPDPRAPEYQRHLAAHEAWWDVIWQAQAARGDLISTLTAEFGPPGYLQTLPYTRMPVAELRDVCDWMAQRQAVRFAATYAR